MTPPHEPTAAPDIRRRRRRAWAATAAALVLVGTGCFVAWGSQAADEPPSAMPRSAAPEATAAPVREAPARVAVTPKPTFVRVPSIGVATPLIRLGLQQDDTVEVPEDGDDAGWFELGTRPGDIGSAVILGHVDSVEGPAVFARLSEMTPGQRVEVDAADGRTTTFEVTKVETVLNGEFPAQRVYGSHGTRNLNLITCGGAYDADNGGYQSNVIVYTRMVGPTEPRSG